MTSELKPCPLCGSEAHTFHNNLWHVRCDECRCCLIGSITEAEAIEAWNTRAEWTCRNVSESEYSFRCSECGATDLDFQYPDFCHGCGAKVVSE